MAAARTKPLVVVTEFMAPQGLELLQRQTVLLYEENLYQRQESLAQTLKPARALIVRNQTEVNATLLAAAPHLQVVGRLGAGLDNIDVAACQRHGVEVVYSPAGNSTSVAEHTLALALALTRRLPAALAMGRRPAWQRNQLTGWELAGKRWGLLGFGRTAQKLAPALRGLGLHPITYHPRKGPGHPDLQAAAVEWVDEDTFWHRSHILSVHLPLRTDTKHYVNRRRLALLPPNSLLIHVSRGGVVDEAALLAGLKAGRPAAAALDVREQEPPSQPDPLAARPEVLLTPHCAGLTVDAQRRIGTAVARDVLRVLAGQRPRRPAPG